MEFALWVLAVVLVVMGIVKLIQRDFLWGVILIAVGLLLGPGGTSLLV